MSEKMFLRTNEALPSTVTQGAVSPLRATTYGELVVDPRVSGNLGYVTEGRYFKGVMPLGTAAITISGTAQTSWVATTPQVIVRNTDKAGGRSIHMDYIRFNIVTQGGATTTRIEAGIALDDALRYSSGGFKLNRVTVTTGGNTIQQGGDGIVSSSIAEVDIGALTATAASGSVRYHSRFNLKAAREVIGDSLYISFNGIEGAQSGSCCANVGPCILGPGGTQSMLFYMWFPGLSTTAITGDYEIAWWER